MYSLEDLRKQNQDITDLCNVLSVLMEKKPLHDNPYVCELMSRFKEKVWMHLVFEDNTIYAELARHDSESVREVARNFHDSAREIKKRFSGYVRHWCKPAIDAAQSDAFLQESREIFALIMERVRYENEHMFPLIEER